ncbi:MAG: pectin acetylesterase-family hydrolase [Anaerolineae bacterium]
MKRTSRLALLLLVAALSAACQLPGLGPQATPTGSGQGAYLAALRAMGLARYVDVEPAHDQPVGRDDWVQYNYDPADGRCIDGSPFFVLARPAGDSQHTLLWLSGGGACWPGQNACTTRAGLAQGLLFGLAYRNVIEATPGPGTPTPVPANPLSDWNIISVPYCDGSVHLGDLAADYNEDGTADHYHQGLRMTSAAVALMKELFPDSTKVLVAGCGAGGYGTILAAPIVRLQFPDAQLYVWNESGPGLYNPDRPDVRQTILDTWNLDPHLPKAADCPDCREQLLNVYGWLLDRDPDLYVGLYSSYQDAVVSDYLGMQPYAYQGLLLTTTDELHARFPDQFRRFLVDGDSHCVDDYTQQVNGIAIRDWIAAMVNGDAAGWPDLRQ